MANKTPPLVIPVVVDATGVSKGLNNVNDRLRRGVSNGNSGDGSFGSGGGMGAAAALAGGIGVAATGGRSAAAAAIGRTISQMNPHFTSEGKRKLDALQRINKVANSTFGGRKIASVAEMFDHFSNNNAMDVVRHESALRASGYGNKDWMWRAHPDRAFSQNKKELWGTRASKVRGMAAEYSYFAGPINTAFNKYANSSNLFYTAAGVAGAAAGVGSMAMNYAQNFKSNASNMQNLVGNPMYGKLRPFQLRQNMAPGTPTNTQSFMAGSLMMSGGKQTRLERHTNSVNSGVSGMMQMMGAAYENPQAAWLGIKAAFGFQVTGNQMIQTVINRSSN